MIKLKFKDSNKEIEFFKNIHCLNVIDDAGIKYAEMINDLDVAEREKEDD